MTRRQSHLWQSSWVPGCQNNAPVLGVVPDLVNDLHASRLHFNRCTCQSMPCAIRAVVPAGPCFSCNAEDASPWLCGNCSVKRGQDTSCGLQGSPEQAGRPLGLCSLHACPCSLHQSDAIGSHRLAPDPQLPCRHLVASITRMHPLIKVLKAAGSPTNCHGANQRSRVGMHTCALRSMCR